MIESTAVEYILHKIIDRGLGKRLIRAQSEPEGLAIGLIISMG